MKRIAIILAALALVGCANLKVEWKASYKTDSLMQDLKEVK